MSEIPPAESGAPPEGGGESAESSSSQTGQDNQIQALTRKLRKLEKQEADRAKADEDRRTSELTEVEKLKKRLAEVESEKTSLQTKHQDALKQARFEQAAAKVGAQNPASAWRLADTSMIELDDSGNVIGVDLALASLQKSDPYLFGDPVPPVSSGGGNPPGGNAAPKYTPDAIKQMSREDFAKFDAGVRSGAIKL